MFSVRPLGSTSALACTENADPFVVEIVTLIQSENPETRNKAIEFFRDE